MKTINKKFTYFGFELHSLYTSPMEQEQYVVKASICFSSNGRNGIFILLATQSKQGMPVCQHDHRRLVLRCHNLNRHLHDLWSVWRGEFQREAECFHH